MATTFERFVQAGAPSIPEPYFYRVRAAESGLQIVVEVRKLNRRFGSTLVASETVYPDPLLPGQTLGKVTAAMVAAWAEVDHASAVVAPLVGDFSAAVA